MFSQDHLSIEIFDSLNSGFNLAEYSKPKL